MPAGGLVTAGVVGLAQAGIGLINKGKANREAKKLAASRPKYTQDPEYQQGLDLAKSELSTGMSGEAKNAYEQGTDRDLSTSLSTILKGGGSVNNVAQVFDASNQGRQRLALMKDNLRLNQISQLMTAQKLHGEEREKAFQFNEWAPWADSAKANSAARTEAEGQIMQGVNTVGSTLIKGGEAITAKKLANANLTTSSTDAGGSSGPARSQVNFSVPMGNQAQDPAAGALPPGRPSVQPIDFSALDNYSLPTMATQE